MKTRELKFRIWDHQVKSFSYVDIRNVFGHLPVDIPDNQIQQFTGCFDRNIKEIYEGDIVKVTSTGYVNDNYIATVVYGEGEFCFKISDNDIRGCWSGYDVEVIGNIFENKDLICDHMNSHFSVNGNCYNCGKLVFPKK